MDEFKGQNSNRQVGMQGESAPIDFFNNVPSFSYFYKKCEKVITALYMVTGLLSDTEPLKWNVRRLGNELLSLSNTIKDKFSTERTGTIYSIRSHILELSSLLDVAKFAGLMSEMNARILKDELKALGDMAETERFDANSGSLLVDRSFFSDPSLADKGGYPREGILRVKRDARKAGHPASQSSPSQELAKGSLPSEAPTNKTLKKERRTEAVLDVIRKKGTVTIKDISLTMQDVSEKTIQRELLALVEAGVLAKEGERRWSRYSLKTP